MDNKIEELFKWSNPKQAQKMADLITQMQQLPFWNIVDIENDFS